MTPFRPWLLLSSRRSARCSRAPSRRGSPPRRAAAAATPSSRRFTSNRGIVRKRVAFVKARRVDPHARNRAAPAGAKGRRCRWAARSARSSGSCCASPIASGASCSSPAPRPAWRPSSARRSAPRSSPSRSCTATTSRPTRSCRRPRERRQLLGLHRVLRRAHALRARADAIRSSPSTCRSTRSSRCWCRSSRASSCRRCAAVQRVTARLRAPGVVQARRSAASRSASSRRPIIVLIGPHLGQPGQGLGHPRRRATARRSSRSPAPRWFPLGWRGVELLALLGAVKIVATCLTVGSGGSAGDFGPSLVIGGLFGGAFGRAAQLLLHDPRIDPGRVRARRHGHVLRRSRPRADRVAGHDVRARRKLRPARPADARRGHRVRRAPQPEPLPRAGPDQARLARAPRGPHLRRAHGDPRRRRPRAGPALRHLHDAHAGERGHPEGGGHGLAGRLPRARRAGQARRHRPERHSPHDGGEPRPRRARDRARSDGAPRQRARHRRPAGARSRPSSSTACARSSSIDDAGRIVGFLDEAEITRTYHSNTASRPG